MCALLASSSEGALGSVMAAVGVGGSEDVTERREADEGKQAEGQRQEAGD